MPAERPRVVVVVPFYGVRDALAATLRTLAEEHFPHDVIVVDDGNDPPLEIPSEWRPQVTVLRQEPNRGITAALNVGLRYAMKAHYEFVARLDAGDGYRLGRLKEQVTYLDKNPVCHLVGTQARFIDRDGDLLFVSEMPLDATRIHRAMHCRCCFIHPTVMFRSAVIRDIGFYREAYPAAEDYDLFFRIVERFAAANLPGVFIDYVVDPQSLSSHRRRRQLLSRLHLILVHFDFKVFDSYRGVAETMISLLLPRWLGTRLRTGRFRFRHQEGGLAGKA